MTADAWWLPSLNLALEQGDVFAEVPFFEATQPIQPLVATSMKHGVTGWMPSEKERASKSGEVYQLANGKLRAGLLLNHGCDIDKPTNKRLTFAAIVSRDMVPEDQQPFLMAQRSLSMFFLPGIPVIGDAFADLRIITTVPVGLLPKEGRVSSMTDDAIARLRAQIIAFYTRT